MRHGTRGCENAAGLRSHVSDDQRRADRTDAMDRGHRGARRCDRDGDALGQGMIETRRPGPRTLRANPQRMHAILYQGMMRA